MKKHVKNSIFIFFLLMIRLNVVGQGSIISSQSKNEYGIFPQVALTNMISTTNDLGVDMYTGDLHIDIPLYELKIKNISIPIGLQYNLNKVKPNIHPGIVGLGWTLQAGGAIHRTVKGHPDEFAFLPIDGYTISNPPIKRGFIWQNYKFYNERESKNMQELYGFDEWGKGEWNQENFVWELAASKINTKNLLGRGSEDYYPDIFSFDFLGYNGSFYLNENGQWQILSDDDFKIEYTIKTLSNARSPINQPKSYQGISSFFEFKLTAKDGTVFIFGDNPSAIDYTYAYFEPLVRIDGDRPVATSWHLSKIILYTGETISFNYVVSKPKMDITYNLLYQSNFMETYASQYVSSDLIMSCLLKSIKYNSFDIDFTYENSIQKKYSNTIIPGIREKNVFIDKFGSNPFIKAFSEIQWEQLSKVNINNSFEYVFQYTNTENDRLKLLSMKKRDLSNNSVAKYEFKYNTGRFPDYWASLGDHQGFYNGKDHQFVLKDGFFKYYTVNSNDFLDASVEECFRASREPDKSGAYFKSEILERISYPVGGYVIFDYETHQVNRYMSLTSQKTMIENYQPQNLIYPGGIRVKRISNYLEDGTFHNAKNYYYVNSFNPRTKSGSNSGIISSLPKYVQRIKAYRSIVPLGDNNYVREFDLFSTNGFNNYIYCKPGYNVGYSTIVESQEDNNGNINGYTEYKFTNFNSDIWGESHLDEMPLSRLNETFHPISSVKGLGLANILNNYIPVSSKHLERGKLISVKIYNREGSLLNERLLKYKKLSNQSIKYIDFFISRLLSPLETVSSQVALGGAYKIFTYKYLLGEEQMKKYFENNNPVTVTNVYEYDSNNQLMKVENRLNGADVYTYQYTYPYNYTTSPFPEMILQNRLSSVIESITTYNNKEIDRKKNNYFRDISKTNNLILPEKIQSSTSGINNLHTDITYDLYDTKGNIRQFTTADGMKTVYLWSYNNQYQIAEIKNATFNEVESAIKTVFSVTSADALSVLSIPNETKLRDGSLQKALPKAIVMTYTYKPFVGMASQTDPSGLTTYYAYDDFGQLKETYILDNNIKRIVKTYNYNYQKK